MKTRWAFYSPLLILIILAFYLVTGVDRLAERLEMGLDPMLLDSVLINKKVPEFELPPIKGTNKGLSNKDLENQIVLVNIFGSWCVACRAEHPFLMSLKKKNVIPIFGINWREPDRTAGPRWLKKHGDPYTLIGDDPKSVGAIAFGVTGAPETFVVDKNNIIRFKHAGPITEEIWKHTLKPILNELRKK